MIILLDNGHGFDTSGKRSPDGHFREYAFNRYLAFRIHEQLTALGLDARFLVPEREDISLKERCRRVIAHGGHTVCRRGRVDTNPKAMYNLQKYNGISSRYTCPHCGRKRCFTLYVDEAGDPLNEKVGRCDHSSSCGYHYTPKQYFADHPDLKPSKDWRDSHPVFVPKPKPKPLCFIPDYIVDRSVRFNHDSDLITFLKTILDPMVVEGLIEQYHIGVTRGRDTIFFQIDKIVRCRTGKVMKYDPDTGHRIKDENTPGRITWVHSLMKQSGQLPRDWELTQCLFGEHLLLENPGMPVALVESEKTAVICAGLMPRYLWLATAGKSCINDRLQVLKGRKIIAFPDIDAFADWSRKLAALAELDP